MRCRIAEEEEPASALAKLHATLEEHILDTEERDFLEPRLAHLLGLAEHQARDQQDLFAAWRLFFERLAESYPTVLAFEDMQWADASLLDFVEYLLDWSRNHPIFVVTLARPELLERRPTWGAGQRSFTSLYLEPLSQQAMEELLAGLVPGLPAEVRDRILARAEGIPLYAVETVRMLLDRGLLVQDGPAYRLDRARSTRSRCRRRCTRSSPRGSTVCPRRSGGSSRTPRCSARPSRETRSLRSPAPRSSSSRCSSALARKEVLGVQADPRSPEHGQYGFLQDLVRHVAYETLSKRERRARHLAAAAHLSAAFAEDEDEVVEVIASHYVAAHEAAPDADDADEIKGKAQAMLVRAGRARRVTRGGGRGEALLRAGGGAHGRSVGEGGAPRPAGEMAARAGDPDSARRLFEESIALYEEHGDTHAAARVLVRSSGESTSSPGVATRRWRGMERAFAVISTDEPDEDLALLAARLSLRVLVRRRSRARGRARGARARHRRGARVPGGTRDRATGEGGRRGTAEGTIEEAQALVKHALQIALDHDLVDEASSATSGSPTCASSATSTPMRSATSTSRSRSHRRRGDRPREWAVLAERTYPLCMLGRWDEAQATSDEFTQEQLDSAD